MKQENILYVIAGLAISVFFAGNSCQSTAPTAKTNLSIMGDLGLLSTANGKVSAEGDVTLGAALVAIDHVELEQEGEDTEGDSENEGNSEGEDEIEFQGPYVIDLLDGAGEPLPDACALSEPGFSDVEEGSYSEVDVKLSPDESLDAACPLAGESVYLAGSVSCGGADIPFTFVSALDEEIEIEGPNAFVVGDDPLEELIVLFQLDLWLDGVDLCSAEVGDDGAIRIDEENNSSLQAEIEANISSSLDAGEDEDGDNELEDDEDLEDDDKGMTSGDSGSETGDDSGSETGDDSGSETGDDSGSETGDDGSGEMDDDGDSSSDDHGEMDDDGDSDNDSDDGEMDDDSDSDSDDR